MSLSENGVRAAAVAPGENEVNRQAGSPGKRASALEVVFFVLFCALLYGRKRIAMIAHS